MAIIVAGDIECFGVSDKFICGTWIYRNKKELLEIYTTTNKKEYENWIIDFAKKQNTEVHAYFHNLGYDFFRFTEFEKRLSIKGKEGYKPISLTSKPIIDYVNENGKPIIKYLDTFRLINKSLKEIGIKLGYEKQEPRKEIQEKYKQDEEKELTKEEIEELKRYNIRDTEICLRIVEFIKEQLKSENFEPRQITTIGQLAIGLFNKRIKELGMKWVIFKWEKGPIDYRKANEYIKTKYPEEIRQAYKTGRIECFQTGKFENCTNIDYNSLFPDCMRKMPFPNLKKEIKINEPLLTYTEEQILKEIGVSKCTIDCPEQEIGYLPIRLKFGTRKKKENKEEDTYIEETYFPDHKCTLKGIWTNYELKRATELGYKIKEIEYSIIYGPIKEKESPMKRFIEECYEKRKKGNLENFFYKYIMNNLHGKFAEKRKEGEYVIDNISYADEYKEKGYEIKTRFTQYKEGSTEIKDINYLYTKTTEYKYAKHFTPILSAYTTAYARDIIYNDLKKIPIEDLIYIGTDGILFKGNHINKFSIGKEIGQYKIIEKDGKKLENVPARAWGKNHYIVGEDIRISGVNKEITKNMKNEEFEKPFEYWKFPTINETNDIQKLFIRKYEEKDLEKIKTKTENLKEYMKTQKVIIDAETKKDENLLDKYINDDGKVYIPV